MEPVSFEALPLHDAKLDSIEVDWAKQRCRFHLSPVLAPGSDAKPHILTFEGVTLLSMPHENPWGPSSVVNSARGSPGSFEIEMQSGDVIEIKARSWTFSAL